MRRTRGIDKSFASAPLFVLILFLVSTATKTTKMILWWKWSSGDGWEKDLVGVISVYTLAVGAREEQGDVLGTLWRGGGWKWGEDRALGGWAPREAVSAAMLGLVVSFGQAIGVRVPKQSAIARSGRNHGEPGLFVGFEVPQAGTVLALSDATSLAMSSFGASGFPFLGMRPRIWDLERTGG